jgi:hypothetical protein
MRQKTMIQWTQDDAGEIRKLGGEVKARKAKMAARARANRVRVNDDGIQADIEALLSNCPRK